MQSFLKSKVGHSKIKMFFFANVEKSKYHSGFVASQFFWLIVWYPPTKMGKNKDIVVSTEQFLLLSQMSHVDYLV